MLFSLSLVISTLNFSVVCLCLYVSVIQFPIEFSFGACFILVLHSNVFRLPFLLNRLHSFALTLGGVRVYIDGVWCAVPSFEIGFASSNTIIQLNQRLNNLSAIYLIFESKEKKKKRERYNKKERD